LIGGVISMGQILSIPMIFIGIGVIVWALRRQHSTPESLPTANALPQSVIRGRPRT
jgi:prolipoprotein diacylglyceryltransferase